MLISSSSWGRADGVQLARSFSGFLPTNEHPDGRERKDGPREPR